jgi:hypothetical protein
MTLILIARKEPRFVGAWGDAAAEFVGDEAPGGLLDKLCDAGTEPPPPRGPPLAPSPATPPLAPPRGDPDEA